MHCTRDFYLRTEEDCIIRVAEKDKATICQLDSPLRKVCCFPGTYNGDVMEMLLSSLIYLFVCLFLCILLFIIFTNNSKTASVSNRLSSSWFPHNNSSCELGWAEREWLAQSHPIGFHG